MRSLALLRKLERLEIRVLELSRELANFMKTNLHELKILKLNRCKKFSSGSISSICELEKLEELDLSNCKITDSDLNLSELISKLPKLQVLNISELDELDGWGLGGLSNLRKLYCAFCGDLKDDGLMSLLRCADKLELLDIRCCYKLTNSLIDVAVEVTKNRTNNVILEIHTNFMKINLDKIKGNSPFLRLIN